MNTLAPASLTACKICWSEKKAGIGTKGVLFAAAAISSATHAGWLSTANASVQFSLATLIVSCACVIAVTKSP